MNDPRLADFYHGWVIELTVDDSGFRFVCYSPSRQRLTDYTLYASDAVATSAAKRLINQQILSHTLGGFLRDSYETGKLSFDEWRSLNQSLNAAFSPR